LSGINSIIQSSNYSTGTTGWKIDGSGAAEFNNLTVRTALDIGGNDNSSFHVDVDGNMWLGAGISSYSTAPFRVSNAGVFYAGNTAGTKYIQWNGTDLITTGQVVSNATVSNSTQTGGTIGGVKVGTTSIYLGVGTYANANTPFYVDTSNQFSLGNKLTWNGSTLSIDGTVTIGGTAGSTIVSGAASGATAVQPAGVNGNVTSISGGVITTGTINLNSVNVNTGTSGARLSIDSTGIKIYDSGGTNTVSLNSDGSASFSGALNGATGSFAGSITIGLSNNVFKANSTDGIWLGNDLFSSAPFRVNLQGNLTSTGTTTINGTLNVGASQTVTGNMNISGTMDVTGSVNVRNIEISQSGLSYRWSSQPPTSGSGTPLLRFDTSGTSTRITQVSSRREIKDNIEDIINGLDIIKKLRPRKFRYKIGDTDPITGERWAIDPNTGEKWTKEALEIQSLSRSYGFIVEEVEEISKNLVEYLPKNFDLAPNEPGGLFDISKWYPTMYKYVDIMALTVKSIQELCDRIEYLESKIN